MTSPSVEKPSEPRRAGRASSPAARKPVEAETNTHAPANGQSSGAKGKDDKDFKLGSFALAIMAAIVILLWAVSTKVMWQFVVAINIGVHVVRAWDRSKKPDLRRLNSDSISFTGDGLQKGRVWVWITATFSHNGSAHLFNNMAMLIATAPELEAKVGAWPFLVIYVSTGASGWLCTYLYNRYFAGGVDVSAMGMTTAEAWDSFTKYNDSIGSSPATYGLGIMCASISPMQQVGSFANFGGWHYIAIIVLTNLLVSNKYGLQLIPGPQANGKKGIILNFKGVLAGMCALCVSSICSQAMPAPTGWAFMCMYLCKTCCLTLFDRWREGRHTPPDNACHLGGAALGYLLSYWWLHMQSETTCCYELNLFAPGLWHPLCLARVSTWCCMGYLLFRLLNKW